MNVTQALQHVLERIDYTNEGTGANPHHWLCARVTPDELAAYREALDAATLPVPDEKLKFEAGGGTSTLAQPNDPPVFVTGLTTEPPLTGDTPQQLDTECFQGQGGAFGGAGSTVQIAEESSYNPPEAYRAPDTTDTGGSADYSSSSDSSSSSD